MKRLNVTVMCQAFYNSGIDVPDDLSIDEAIEYARKNVKEIPLGVLEWVPDSDEIDEENCDFDDCV